ncbi:MAG: NAD(P)H-binding protein [Bacteroidales bacterium]
MMNKKTAILFGATGLTGAHVLQKLVRNERYEKVIVFTRSEPDLKNDKIEIINTDLEKIGDYANKISGDDVFCCLGTTIKKAGSKENFRKVDFEFPVNIARIASNNNVPNFLIISSVGADPKSSNFYLRTKGETEKAVQEFSFKKVVILRPSMLLGKRKEFRFLEEAGRLIMIPVGFLLRGRLKKYRAIESERVAEAMVKFANITTSKKIFESHEIELFTKT